jgi:hypothetical protein
MDWFGLVCELHGVEVGYFETVTPNFRLRNILSVGQPLKLTSGPLLSLFWSFSLDGHI